MQELRLGEVSLKKFKSKTSIKNIVLVGQPNCGKSTLFNALSDIKVSTANFAGTTVEYKDTLINVYGQSVYIIDLPGIYSLNPTEPAEFATFNYLLNNYVDLIINVIDSTLVTKSLELTIELSQLGIPIVIALNMDDEAKNKGIEIDNELLSNFLGGIPIVKISALYRQGMTELLNSIYAQLFTDPVITAQIKFSKPIEDALTKLSNIIEIKSSNTIQKRFFLIKALENEGVIKDFVRINDIDSYLEIKKDLSQKLGVSIFEIFAGERNQISTKIAQQVTKQNPKPNVPLIEKIDLLFLKPSTGYFFAIIFFVLYFTLIFILGGWLSEILERPLENLFTLIEPLKSTTQLGWFAADGIIQGIVGAIGIVLPYFLPLLFLTAILEESGYMARIAYLMDVVFHQIGLHGKSVASFIMGFGCTVPAVFATRIIENRRDRLLASILINFIPCSARLTVIFALTTALTGPIWTVIIFSYILLAIASTAKILSWFLPKPTGLIMEIPPLRLPSLEIVLKKTYFKILEFFKIAFPFLLLGSLVLAILEYLNFHLLLNSLLSPLIQNILGLPRELGTALVFGFLRKELAVFMIARSFGTNDLHLLPMTIPQVVTFVVFIVFYLPCISTTAVFWKEFGWRHLLLTITIGLALSIISALTFRFAITTFL